VDHVLLVVGDVLDLLVLEMLSATVLVCDVEVLEGAGLRLEVVLDGHLVDVLELQTMVW